MADDAAPSNPDQPTPTPGGQQPAFDPTAPHMARPRLRRVRGFAMPVKGPDGKQQTLLGIADAQQISDRVVATAPAFQVVLPLMDGSRDLPQIVAEVGRGLTEPMLQSLVAQLSESGLIYGPPFEAMQAKVRADFDSAETLPPGATAQFADAVVAQKLGGQATDEQKAELGPQELRTIFDTWCEQALQASQIPPFESLPAAVVAPHVDYPRGWQNYASVYGRLRGLTPPDRVVILGTNHFGSATGVCGCNKGFASPLGVSPLDTELLDALTSELGPDGAERLLKDRYDHEREHSIELHVPWIQHCLGPGVKVLGVLVHDPAANNGESYDGEGLALEPFIAALRAALTKVGGTTLVVSSADLSHVGPAFGDEQPLAGDSDEAKAAREKFARHDHEMLKLYGERKPDDLIAAMAWQRNPTRWCSVGNMVAAMRVVEPEQVRLLNYAAAMDPQGTTCVSHAAMAMF